MFRSGDVGAPAWRTVAEMDPTPYASPGPMTELLPEQVTAVRALDLDPEGCCRAAQGLLVDPEDAFGTSLSPTRLAERNTRSAAALLARVTELDPSPLDRPRRPEDRVVGTCRHFAVLATALLRASAIPARARCGFAGYFVADKWVDHWVTEHWSPDWLRWHRVDAEIIDLGLVGDPFDLAPTEFLTGGEAWQEIRAGRLDAAVFGVVGTEHWGPGEIRGNAIRDLAALNKVEVLPWDEWGDMPASYASTNDASFDTEIDELAAACATDDPDLLAEAYARFAVPAALLT